MGSTGLRKTQTASKMGRLTLETIAGTEWVRRAWNVNDLAPAKPEVTLALKDGKFAGALTRSRIYRPVLANVRVRPIKSCQRSQCSGPFSHASVAK